MNKFLIILLALIISATAFSQSNSIAVELVRQNGTALGLSPDDISNSTVSSSYIVSGTSIRMVYLQQLYKEIPVHNQVQVIAFQNDLPVSNMGGRIGDMDNKTQHADGVPAITAAAALQSAFAERSITYNQAIQPIAVTDNGRTVSFGDLGVSYTGIVAKQVWVQDSTGLVALAWQVDLSPRGTSDHWLIHINAATAGYIDKNNFTVYCSWDKSENDATCIQTEPHQHTTALPTATAGAAKVTGPDIINGATYTVIPYPAESPIHPGGTPASRTDPWLLAPAGSNATSLKWHSNGTTDYTITRGNNVWAYEDRNFDNIAGAADTSSTADPLTFSKVYNFTLEPIVTNNQRAATTNLFYWNNIIHDISYIYGFNEAAGNFQVNNQGRGGTGNDAVNAEAQDGGGTNNANFSTPVDGSAGRMQMYLWTAPTPDRDGDLDNGIVIHEYGHGISNRFTGGPANSSCLGNQEQMGEGWSDYFGLMLTQDWSTSLITDGFNKPRGIGTYALNQPITGVGIRTYPYTTNMAVNPFTYANITSVAVPHGVGSVWCTILWDMTWDMIQLDGINPNLYNVSGTGGNSAALKLVSEGMRLQPCSPGFVTGRDAILKADTLFFGARYSCIIWKAFARRGVGVNASQGLSTSRSDQVVDFTTRDMEYSFTQSVTQQFEGQNIVYNTTLKSVCLPISNYKIVDTLPVNVTHVSGGTYDAGNRTVTFSGINLTAGNSQTSSFTVKVNTGAYFPPVAHINETVAGSAIPASWTASSTTGAVWKTSTAQSTSAPNSFFTRDTTIVSDQVLATTGSFAINGATTLSFQHLHNAEANWDGGVVEISTNNGATWSDLGNFFTSNGYTSTLGTTGGNPLAGRRAFSGNSATFKLSVIDLSSFKGQTVKIRFRFGSDNSTGTTTGWYIDDIKLNSEAAVFNTAKLFDGTNTLKSSKDLITKIIAAVLPLNLVSFGGYLQQRDAILQWKTSSEVNTQYFYVERSFDGSNFNKAGELAATANAAGSGYGFTDAGLIQNPAYKGVVYYRLKMLDRDGAFTFSKVVRLSSVAKGLLTVSPNPVKDQLAISGFTDNRLYNVSVTDMSGKILQTGRVSFLNNRVDVSSLSSGMYIISLQGNNGPDVYRFVKE
jgi:Fungalysin metallopeptidase (M36)/Secretion system C-terminal sorting domain